MAGCAETASPSTIAIARAISGRRCARRLRANVHATSAQNNAGAAATASAAPQAIRRPTVAQANAITPKRSARGACQSNRTMARPNAASASHSSRRRRPARARATTSSQTSTRMRVSALALLFDVHGERAQASENALVVGVVRAQLETVALGYRERQFERVDRIQSGIGTEQGFVRIDVGRL